MKTMIKVREIRMEKGLSQAELAYRANISRSYLSMIEAGLKHPNARRLHQIAEALGVPVTSLLEEDAERAHLREHMDLVATLTPEDQRTIIDLARRLARSQDA